MRPSTRKLLAAVGGVLVLLLVLLVLLPVLFAGPIERRVKTAVNGSVNARVDWRGAGLGLFHDFPNLSLRLDDLSVAGTGRFQGDTLAAVRQLYVVVDLASAVKTALGGSAPVVVRGVELDRPRLSLLVLEDGTANWDIMKPSAPRQPGRAVSVSLKRFALQDGAVAFHNRAAKMDATLAGLDGSLSGDLSKEKVDLETRAHADTATVTFAGVTYLNGVRLDAAANLAADLVNKIFTLRDGSSLRVNALELDASGTVAQRGERLGLDLAFAAPKAGFREILSLVPAVYLHDFQRVQTSGTLAMSGTVKGEYGKDAFPAFSLAAKVENGAFKYPDLPLPARGIMLDLALTNPGGSADSTVVNLSRFHALIGSNPIDARMTLRTPVSDPDVDARLRGTLDLADLRRTIKLDSVEQLAGIVSADAAVRTRMSWVDQGQYDRVAASGTVSARDLSLESAALRQPLAIREATLALAPRRAELRSLSGTAGSSDFRASGYLDNVLGYVLRDEDLRGNATINSNRFVLDEWRSDSGGLTVIPVPKGLDVGLDATVGEMLYGKLKMTGARGRVHVKDQRLTIESFTLNTLGGSMGVNGYYETTNPAKPTFDVGLRMTTIDIPSAVASLATVRAFAPVAKYAQGSFSTDLRLTGPLQQDMMPVFAALTGQGSLETSQLLLKDFPALEKLADRTKLTFLTRNAIRALRSQFQIRNGRLLVQPFTVALGQAAMTVSGSNGIDQTLDYDLRLKVPRSLVPAQATQAIAGLVSKAAAAGVNLQTAPEISLAARVGGKVTDPSISVDLAGAAQGAAQAAGQALQQAAEQKAQAVADTAKQRLSAEAQKLVQEAEARAAKIRAEARALADTMKRTANQRADSLVARSGDNPLARAAATAAANKLRSEADDKAAALVRSADARADSMVAQARRAAPAQAPQ